jgi:hypothetical protein
MTISDMKPKVSPENIVRMADSYQSFQVLFTAVKYDIFSVLSEESKTVEQVAQGIGTDSYITEKLLNALVSIGLLAKGSGKYSNTALAETFLVKGKPFYQGNYIKTAKPISFGTGPYDDWAKIGQALEQGYVQQDVGVGVRLYDESFSLAMKEGAVRGEVQATAEVISSYTWFKNAKKLLDIGGTHGLYAIAFADINPELEATLFDFPGVPELAGAEKLIEQYGINSRVEIREGNFFMGGDIGEGYDIVFISHVYLQGDILDRVLSRIHGALNENGRFILKNCVIYRNRKGSFVTALHDLDMCFWGDEHQMSSIDEYVDLIETQGFRIENVAKIEECSYSPSAILTFKRKVKNERH